ncbi:MAG: CD1247 N-terminal domain-containing protein [Oscillospiraceae bacterium]
MELSKKVGYIKGLMAGLKISEETPEGMVLHAMSDLLEEMAEEIEINADIIDNITAYIDEVEDNCDCLDDILAEEYDEDPCGFFDDCECDDCECDDCDDIKELDALLEGIEKEFAFEQETDGEPEEADEESVAEESVAEEPAVEEPVAEEPAVEEPVAEEPAVEESAAEEPVENPAPVIPPVEEEVTYECECPICHTVFNLTQQQLDSGSVECPVCRNMLEFA